MSKEVLALIFTIALVLLLLLFIYLSVLIVRKKALKSVRSKTMGLISMYDDLIEAKSKELNELEKIKKENAYDINKFIEEAKKAKQYNLDRKELSKTIINTAENLQVDYRGNGTMDSYQLIRENFNLDPIATINSLNLKVTRSSKANQVLKELSFDSVYSLSSLPKDKQVEILKSLRSPAMDELVDRFIEENKEFDIIQFYEFVKNDAYYKNELLTVRVPRSFNKPINGVNLVYDDDIAEGFQVENGSKLYDYSIQKRDVN